MGETTDNRPNNQEGQSFTAREFELIQELVRSRMIWKEIYLMRYIILMNLSECNICI